MRLDRDGRGTRNRFEAVLPGLHAGPPTRLIYRPDVHVRSFLLQRAGGNVLVYNSPGLSRTAEQIRELGGAGDLLLNHAHESMYGTPTLDTRIHINARDAAEASRAMRIDDVFTGPSSLGEDLQIIPTPGHTPGTSCFLWSNGGRRLLFAGDFLWIDRGRWSVVLLDSGARDDYLDSLRLIRGLDFDVLVPWGATAKTDCLATTSTGDARARLDDVIIRVAAGADR